jgi:hypothetical protein
MSGLINHLYLHWFFSPYGKGLSQEPQQRNLNFTPLSQFENITRLSPLSQSEFIFDVMVLVYGLLDGIWWISI